MKWTTPDEIKRQLNRIWLRGDICRASVVASELFPLAIALRQPSAKVMLDDFSGVQNWAKNIQAYAQQKHIQLEWKQVNHRALGQQSLPCRVLLENAQQVAGLLGKGEALKRFNQLYRATGKYANSLQSWALKHPIKVLELANQWQNLLDLCVWMQAHPRPKIYLRQVDVAGVDSKFIEQHKKILAALFDVILPVYAIDDDFSGAAGFARRYGFLDKPVMLRLRPLDDKITWLACEGSQDVMVTAKAFAQIHPDIQAQVQRVFIVENEINYLCFPDVEGALLIFGSGYGFEALKQASWLTACQLYYWGDLDTHGFAILNQLRSVFPAVCSFLMDEQTFKAHAHAWGNEPKQEMKNLTHLSQAEADMYDLLRFDCLGEKLRLEQERIAYGDVLKVLRGYHDA
ncbi:MAG: DUF2220 family protein [Mariprofundales bacterium]